MPKLIGPIFEQQHYTMWRMLQNISISGPGVSSSIGPLGIHVVIAPPRSAVGQGGGGEGDVPVDCSSPSGSAGNSTTAAAFTYTIKRRGSSTTLATSVAVVMQRPIGLTTAATHGYAYYDSSAAVWKLWWCDEIVGAVERSCT